MAQRDLAGAAGSPGRAEVIAALSLALDLGLGQPMDHMLRSAIIASRLSERMGLAPQERAAAYYSGLVAWVGCHAESHEVAAVFGDDVAYRADTFETDLTGLPLLRLITRHLASDSPPLRRGARSAAFLLTARARMTRLIESHYVSAGALADRLGLGDGVREAVGHFFERWDGRGLPTGAAGTAIPVAMRIVHLADVVEVHLREAGPDGALEVARRRSGTQFDPEVVSAFERLAPEILAGLPTEDAWEVALALAPDQGQSLTAGELDDLLMALGDFVDLKSPGRQGHSRAVASLAAQSARLRGLAPDDVTRLRRAGWLHDLGRMGVSNAIWEKTAPLSTLELERVRLYPYLTQRIVHRVRGLAEVAVLAGLHRERLDGSGYPKGVDGSFLSAPARLLAAADAYQSLTEPRPHRPALPPAVARARLQDEARAGRLDGAAVDAVLAAAGQPSARRPAAPAGLTARELEVLRMVALGCSSRVVADELVISEKTVRNHLEHIYAKVGVTNRVSASLFALQHGIVRAADTARGGTVVGP